LCSIGLRTDTGFLRHYYFRDEYQLSLTKVVSDPNHFDTSFPIGKHDLNLGVVAVEANESHHPSCEEDLSGNSLARFVVENLFQFDREHVELEIQLESLETRVGDVH
jgi:hypothetical protein